MPGMPGKLRRDAEAVGDDRQLAPAAARLELASDRERGRAGVHHDALAILHEGCAGGTDDELLVGLEALADVECEFRPAAVDRDRAAVGPDQPAVGLEPDEVLADGDRRDLETGRQLADANTAVLVDDAHDVLLPFAGEDVASGGAGWNGHASPPCDFGTSRGFVWLQRHSKRHVNAMSR